APETGLRITEPNPDQPPDEVLRQLVSEPASERDRRGVEASRADDERILPLLRESFGHRDDVVHAVLAIRIERDDADRIAMEHRGRVQPGLERSPLPQIDGVMQDARPRPLVDLSEHLRAARAAAVVHDDDLAKAGGGEV